MSKSVAIIEAPDLKDQRLSATEGLIVLDQVDARVQDLEAQIAEMKKISATLREELVVIQRTGKTRERTFDEALKQMYHRAVDLQHASTQPLTVVKLLLTKIPEVRFALVSELWRKAKQALSLLFMA
jgi:hypothetical protein